MRAVVIGCSLAAVFWFVMFSPWTASAVNFWLGMTPATGVLSVFALVLGRQTLSRVYRFELKWLAIGIASAVVLYLVFFIGDRLASVLFDFASPEVEGIYGTKAQAAPALIGTLLLFWIGPAEEVFWRGFIQHRLAGRFGEARGFLLAAAVYAFVHIWAFNLMLFGAALVCGLFWGWMFLRYKSVWPGLISHALWDLTIFVLLPIH